MNETASRVVQHGADRWTVREVDAHRVPGSRGPRCLICESANVIRRLWRYPDDWSALDDKSLWDLCEQDAVPAPSAAPRPLSAEG